MPSAAVSEPQTDISSTKPSQLDEEYDTQTVAAKNVTVAVGPSPLVMPDVQHFRCSPKTRKAPPVPPPPTTSLVSKDSRRQASADGDKTSVMLPVKGDADGVSENNEHFRRDLSPSSKCTSAASSSTSAVSLDSKPALKPKPSTAVSREMIGSEGVCSLPNNKMCCSCQQTSVSTTTVTAASQPVYAIVNKSRTQRSTSSNVDDDTGSISKSSTKVTVARSKSAVAACATPPKKPPRTFAHSEYMRLKSLSLPRSPVDTGGSCDGEELKMTSCDDADDERVLPISEMTVGENADDSSVAVSRQPDASSEHTLTQTETGVEDGGTEAAVHCSDGSGIVRRHQSDKLPAPPRPPPPSLSCRSSVLDTDAAAASDCSETCPTAERLSLALNDRQNIGHKSVSDIASDDNDDDDTYAIPDEVASEVTGKSSRMSCLTVSRTTHPTPHSV